MNQMHVVTGERPVAVPPLTRGWRMQMAMDWAGVTREHMAAVLQVSVSTVTRWMHDQGKKQPRRPDMEIWARECHVPIEWLAPDSTDEMPAQPTVPSIPPYLADLTDEPENIGGPRAPLYLVPSD